MTRIVQLANFYGPESGGLRVAVDELGRGYTSAGVDRFIVVPGPHDRHDITESGIRITLASPKLPGGGGYHVLSSRRRVTDVLQSIQPDRLEVSDKLSLTWVGRWAAERGVPCTLFSHERIDAILAVRVPRWFPLVRAADRWNRRLADRFERIVCTSAFACEEFARVGAPAIRVPLGVDLDAFSPSTDFPTRRGVELVCVGRLSQEKRPDLAVETLRRLVVGGVDARLTMLGAGPLAGELARLAGALPVTFLGHVQDRTLVAASLRQADVVIAPCPAETFGLSVLEALASGTPVVVADRGAASELIDDRCGRAAGPDPTALADAVAAVLAIEPGTRRDGARARAEQYPWSRTVAGMLAIHDVKSCVGVPT